MDQLKYSLKTFGCKVNTYDSGLLEKRFTAKGWSQSPSKDSNIYILNTCAVTEAASREALKEARRIKAKNPFGLVVVTGCAAQVDTDLFEKVPGIDLVVANSHKGQLEEIVEDYYKGKLDSKVFKSNIFKKDDLEAGGGLDSTHSRAFLKIQDGCNSFCTFCVIPFARGKSRSLSVNELVRRVNTLYAQGFREVVITGVHIGDYQDENQHLEDLVEALLSKTLMPRFRISSLEPIELSDRLLELYKHNDRLCPHFHLSIQSANSKVLHSMKRKYGQSEVLDVFDRIQKHLPEAYVGMDVIVGFPDEGETEFDDTYSALENSPWSRIHVFSYSKRPGTYAARLKNQVSPQEIKRRARVLRTLSQERIYNLASKHLGSDKLCLPLASSEGVKKYLSRDYLTVVLPASAQAPLMVDGEVRLKIDQVHGDRRPGLDPMFWAKVSAPLDAKS